MEKGRKRDIEFAQEAELYIQASFTLPASREILQ